MFTKKFNNLSDSLIEAAAKTLAKPIVNEASNETPTINHLELSEEEINELSPAALQKYKAVSRERMRDQGVVGKELQKRQTGYSTATKKLSGDAKVGAKEPEKKPEPSFGVKVGKITPKTPYKSSYSMIKEPPQRGSSSMPAKAAASPMKEEEEINELSREKISSYMRGRVRQAAERGGTTGSQQKSLERASRKINSPQTIKVPATPMKEEEEEAELSPKQKKIAQISPPEHKIDAGDLAKLRAGHKIEEAKRGRKPKGDDDEEGPHYDEREDPETGEITRVKDTVPPNEHIMNQLRQAALSMKAQHPVTYADGSTHNVPKHVAKALVNAYQDPRKKPYEKEAMQAKIGQSHKALMQHHSELNEDSYNPKLSHKGKMLDEVPVETMKQVKMVNQEEAEEEPPFEPTRKVNWKASKQSRAKWLAKAAMEKMKKKSMKEEEAVKPGAQYAKKVSVPEEVSEEPMSHQAQTTMKHIKNPTPGEKKAAKDIKPGVAGYRDRIDMLKSAQQRNEEVESIDEREMSSDEKAKREKIVMALKKKMAGFKKRYGSRAKDVMYATATKQAMKTEETPSGPKDGVKINPAMSTKEGIGVKSTTT
jgi:hypothetical protein